MTAQPASRRQSADASAPDALGAVFAALADPTRRHVIETLVREGSTSAPSLAARLPISRQAVAKHLTALGEAGLIERVNGISGREVRYQLRPGALNDAGEWMRATAAAWDERLARLKERVERG